MNNRSLIYQQLDWWKAKTFEQFQFRIFFQLHCFHLLEVEGLDQLQLAGFNPLSVSFLSLICFPDIIKMGGYIFSFYIVHNYMGLKGFFFSFFKLDFLLSCRYAVQKTKNLKIEKKNNMGKYREKHIPSFHGTTWKTHYLSGGRIKNGMSHYLSLKNSSRKQRLTRRNVCSNFTTN